MREQPTGDPLSHRTSRLLSHAAPHGSAAQPRRRGGMDPARPLLSAANRRSKNQVPRETIRHHAQHRDDEQETNPARHLGGGSAEGRGVRAAAQQGRRALDQRRPREAEIVGQGEGLAEAQPK